MAKRAYVGSCGAARRLGVAERTIRDWASKFDWFGGMLENKDLVFTEEDIEKMRTFPKPGPGRPRKMIVDVPPEMPTPEPEEAEFVPPPVPSLPVLAG